MKVLYILNDSCFYRRMCWFSINSLRFYNKSIEIEILYICDNGKDNRKIANLNDFDLGIPWFTREMFIEEMSKFNVIFRFVYDCDLGEESGFPSAQRKEFTKVNGKDILLLDSDTFIFDDIEPLFLHTDNAEIVASKTEWGECGGIMPILGTNLSPFNSGVVLFKDNLLQKYGAAVYDLILEIKYEKTDLGKWYGDYERKYSPKEAYKLGREEIAFSNWVIKEKLKYKYFDQSEVQTVNYKSKTIIYHTMTQNWLQQWVKFYRGRKFLPPKKLNKRLFMKSSA